MSLQEVEMLSAMGLRIITRDESDRCWALGIDVKGLGCRVDSLGS